MSQVLRAEGEKETR